MSHHDPVGMRGCLEPLPSVLGSLGVDVYKCVGLLDDALTGSDRSVGLSTLEADSALSPSYCTWEVGDGGLLSCKLFFLPSAPLPLCLLAKSLPCLLPALAPCPAFSGIWEQKAPVSTRLFTS